MPSTPKVFQRSLVVSEIFGPTFQGEGPSAGQLAVFLRLSGCNLNCRWCDTPYTWDWTRFSPRAESKVYAVTQIRDILEQKRGEHHHSKLVITGGEPMLQQMAISQLLDMGTDYLFYRGIEIETNGTKPNDHIIWWPSVSFNVSPKLKHSGCPIEKSQLEETLSTMKNFILKFVVEKVEDLDEVAELIPFKVDPHQIWIMPQGTKKEEIDWTLSQIADQTLKRGWNLTSRLHVSLWGDVRGR